jgi:hypothetical protein
METCQNNEAIGKNGGNVDVKQQSLLQQALQAISLQSGCGTGLSSKPLMLFLLLMDNRTDAHGEIPSSPAICIG